MFEKIKEWLSSQSLDFRQVHHGPTATSEESARARGVDLAEFAEAGLRESGRWEIVTPAQLAVVTFRHVTATDEAHARLVERLVEDGSAMVSTTVLRGRTVLRLCTINPRTAESDIRDTIERMEQFIL